MLIPYVLLALLFILGLISTKVFSFPSNKLAAWFDSLFLQDSSSKMEQNPSETGPSSTSTAEQKTMKSSSNQFKAELKSVFATFDKNKDGFITSQELKESLKNIGITMSEKDVKEMVERVDANGDGLIDLDEFCDLFESIISNNNNNNESEEVNREGEEEEGGSGYLKEAFDVFDGDGDGVITVNELGRVLTSLGFKEGTLLENCKEMIRKVDVDGDGCINFAEFKKMMNSSQKLLSFS